MDIILASIGVVLCIPVWIVSAIAIVFDSPGPVMYRQVRLGMGGRPFLLWKLRTMVQNAEIESGAVWSMQDDPRVTRIGRWLRKFHIDETPQLWNVLKGDMSLIGPRPERPEIIESLQETLPHYHRRHQLRPGITGLAQISRGYDSCVADVRKKLRYDMLYCKKCCALLDLLILWRTSRALRRGL